MRSSLIEAAVAYFAIAATARARLPDLVPATYPARKLIITWIRLHLALDRNCNTV